MIQDRLEYFRNNRKSDNGFQIVNGFGVEFYDTGVLYFFSLTDPKDYYIFAHMYEYHMDEHRVEHNLPPTGTLYKMSHHLA